MKFIILSITILLSGCFAYNYIPTPVYVPVNREKGIITTIVSYNYFQIGYAFSNHFSVYTAGNGNRNNIGIFWDDADLRVGYRINNDKFSQFDIGGSYFKPLGRYFSYEIVSGIGTGKVDYRSKWQYLDDSPSPLDYEFSFTSQKAALFIQPCISFKEEDFFDFTIFSRLNYTRYYDLNSSLDLGSGYYTSVTKYDSYFFNKRTADLYFFEPGFQLELGYKNYRGVVSWSKAISLQSGVQGYRKSNLYLGFHFSYNLLEDLKNKYK